MRRQALVPVRDPRLAESLAFENMYERAAGSRSAVAGCTEVGAESADSSVKSAHSRSEPRDGA